MKHLKRGFAVLLCLLCLLSLASCTDWEEGSYVEYTCPDSLRLVTAEMIDKGECDDLLEAIGKSADEALSTMSERRLFFSAFLPREKDGKTTYPVEMAMTLDTNMATRNIFNFSTLSEEDWAYLYEQSVDVSDAEKEGCTVADVSEFDHDGIRSIHMEYSSTQQGETVNIIVYETIYNGFVYKFFCVTDLPIDDEIRTAAREMYESVRFTKTLEPKYEFIRRMTFGDTVKRFLQENWLVMLIVSAVTIAATIAVLLLYSRHKEKHKNDKKHDGIVRADYLK